MIAEGLALIDKAMRHRRPGPYQVQAAIAALHARAARRRTPTGREIDLLYATLERLQPSPVVTLNRAVAVAKVARAAEAALAMIEPLASRARRLFPFLRRCGARCCCSSAAPTRRAIAFDRAIALANTPAEAAHIRHAPRPADARQWRWRRRAGRQRRGSASSRRASRVISIATRNPVDLE